MLIIRMWFIFPCYEEVIFLECDIRIYIIFFYMDNLNYRYLHICDILNQKVSRARNSGCVAQFLLDICAIYENN